MQEPSELEARLQFVEEEINKIGDLIRNLQDVAGQLKQNQQMARVPTGSGAGPRSMSAVVATTIAAAPDANTLGQGTAVLRNRDGASLSDGRTVTVYSNMTVAIEVGTRIEIEPDREAYKLVTADGCPPPP